MITLGKLLTSPHMGLKGLYVYILIFCVNTQRTIMDTVA